MEYMLIEGLTREDFEEQVQRFLDDGWKLEGSVVIAPRDSAKPLFYQAMLRDRGDEFVGVN